MLTVKENEQSVKPGAQRVVHMTLAIVQFNGEILNANNKREKLRHYY